MRGPSPPPVPPGPPPRATPLTRRRRRPLSAVRGATPRTQRSPPPPLRDELLVARTQSPPNEVAALAEQLRLRLRAADAQIHALVESNEALDDEVNAERGDGNALRAQLERSKAALRDALKSRARKSVITERHARAAASDTVHALQIELGDAKEKLTRVENIVAHQQRERVDLLAKAKATEAEHAAARRALAQLPALQRRAAAAMKARADAEALLASTQEQLQKSSDMVRKLWKRNRYLYMIFSFSFYYD